MECAVVGSTPPTPNPNPNPNPDPNPNPNPNPIPNPIPIPNPTPTPNPTPKPTRHEPVDVPAVRRCLLSPFPRARYFLHTAMLRVRLRGSGWLRQVYSLYSAMHVPCACSLPLCFHSTSTLLPLCFHSTSTLLRLCFHSASTLLPLYFHSTSTPHASQRDGPHPHPTPNP